MQVANYKIIVKKRQSHRLRTLEVKLCVSISAKTKKRKKMINDFGPMPKETKNEANLQVNSSWKFAIKFATHWIHKCQKLRLMNYLTRISHISDPT